MKSCLRSKNSNWFENIIKRLKERLAIIQKDWLVGKISRRFQQFYIFFRRVRLYYFSIDKKLYQMSFKFGTNQSPGSNDQLAFFSRSFGLFRGSLIEVIMKLTWFLVPLQINLIMIWFYRMGKRHQLWIQHHLDQKVLGLLRYGPYHMGHFGQIIWWKVISCWKV